MRHACLPRVCSVREVVQLILLIPLIAVAGCVGGGDGPSSSGSAASTTPSAPPPRDLNAALEAAANVDIPAVRASVVDRGRDAVFASTSTTSFVESLDLSVTETDGRPGYSFTTRTTHHADGRAMLATLTVEGLRDQFLRQQGGGLQDLPRDVQDRMLTAFFGPWSPLTSGRLEIIRHSDRYWLRSGREWTRVSNEAVFGQTVDLEWPVVLRLSRTLRSYLESGPAESGVVVNGRPTNRYRVEHRPAGPRTSDGGPLLAQWPQWTTLPNVDLHRDGVLPAVAAGGVDAWIQADDLLVRAVYEVHLVDGRTLRARVEASRFGAADLVRPPE